MNGIDHAMPQAQVGAVAELLARKTGWTVRRGLLEDFAHGLPREAPRFRGELTGARTCNLLPGVWSTRVPLKLRNRRIEMLLESWAEPWSALGRVLGTADERPALRLAWRALLQNQAHDSICGCSHDRVHEQMQARYDTAEELADQTTRRVLEHLAGLGSDRRTPTGATFEIAVFNPSPHARTDVVRFVLDPLAWFEFGGVTVREMAFHPWVRTSITAQGFTVNGQPARLLVDDAPGRIRLAPELPPHSIEFVAHDVPACGWRRFTIAPSAAHPDHEDDGRQIACGDVWVRAADDGTFELRTSRGVYTGLCGVEDVGDRGDSYDCDPVSGGAVVLADVEIRRSVHPSGIQELTVRRTFNAPVGLAPDRARRSPQRVALRLETQARLAPGFERVDLRVALHNTAKDHRLRLLFPTGRPVLEFEAATTLDIMRRRTRRPDDTHWVHPAPTTFVQHGFVSANGLTVGAPGLPEAEVTPEGAIAITLVRAVGWLARMDLKTRPQLAGPIVETPGAQCLGRLEAHLSLSTGLDPRAVGDAELGLHAVPAGDAPLLQPGQALLTIEPRAVLLSALKPAEDGAGVVVRLLNPTDTSLEARLDVGFPFSSVQSVQLDESSAHLPVRVDASSIWCPLPPHALRTLRFD